MHIMHYFHHEKTSKKSPKSFLRDEKDAPSCPRVAFTPLKLLRDPLKVTPGHPKSYSRIGSKFAISSGFYSIFTPSRKSYFNTPNSNCQNNNALGKTAILTFIREQQIFSWKICACRARIIMQNLNKCAFCPISSKGRGMRDERRPIGAERKGHYVSRARTPTSPASESSI